MTTEDQPDWQPITALPLIGAMIRGMLAEGQEQYQLRLQARLTPHVLDDSAVGRVFEAFGTQKEDFWPFEEQLVRWRREMLTAEQQEYRPDPCKNIL